MKKPMVKSSAKMSKSNGEAKKMVGKSGRGPAKGKMGAGGMAPAKRGGMIKKGKMM